MPTFRARAERGLRCLESVSLVHGRTCAISHVGRDHCGKRQSSRLSTGQYPACRDVVRRAERTRPCPTTSRPLRLAGIPGRGATLGLARSRHEQNAVVVGLGLQQPEDDLEDNDPVGSRIAASGGAAGRQGAPRDLSATASSRGLEADRLTSRPRDGSGYQPAAAEPRLVARRLVRGAVAGQ